MMNVTALLTRFAHHAPTGGYKRVLHELTGRGVRIKEFGNDETNPGFPAGFWDRKQQSYKWIAEWRAARWSRRPDLVHVMYGEEYFRFSPWLFRNTPIVATFHQPAALLEREISCGDLGGRVASWTHRITRRRFQKLSAAIVTNPDQIKVLTSVMPPNRINLIPLGVDLPEVSGQRLESCDRNGVITVGSWLRDWELFQAVALLRPNYRFTLVSRNLDPVWRQRFAGIPNIRYLAAVDDVKLLEELLLARVAFLPLRGLAGSNALLECLAAGLPLVMTDVSAETWRYQSPVINLFPVGDPEGGARELDRALLTNNLAKKAREIASGHAWPEVAARTFNLYQSIL